ncbi:protocadherin Fat 4-like [Anneissia japonica]|uniref:protocadherin Fat 4-like n=1 Tax=Anneissia japonica TaxID=1529436 RepID=UPI001425511D|nr:protocadherin Fat 4-like [Anneissia japonica]
MASKRIVIRLISVYISLFVSEPEAADPFLAFSNTVDIRRFDLDGTNYKVVAFDLSNVVALDFDFSSSNIYWCDDISHKIQRTQLTGRRAVRDVVTSNVEEPRGIAVDWVGRKIYWTDTARGVIESVDLNGENRTAVITEHVTKPHAIVLHPHEKLLFFSDVNDANPAIHRAMLPDGSNQEIIVSNDLIRPNALTIDYENSVTAVHSSKQLQEEDVNYCSANDGNNPCGHICIDFYGNYQCDCLHGYELASDLHTCEDINECSLNNGGCMHHCVNKEGGYSCDCIEGFEIANDGKSCIDSDDCYLNNGGCEFGCFNTGVSYICTCPTGYELADDGHSCIDIDECLQNTCPESSQCMNNNGSFVCLCDDGLYFDAFPFACIDVDECVTQMHVCSQRCVNTPGSYRCDCNSGFELLPDDMTCLDIDECTRSHDCHHSCMNVAGSYLCYCEVGYTLNKNGKNCTVESCGMPDDVPGFILTCQSSYYLATCHVQCIQGSILGSPVITCQSDGRWSPVAAECLASPDMLSNSPPADVWLSSNSVPEDAFAGDIVGYLHTFDLNPEQNHVYVLDDDISGKFYIDNQLPGLRTHGNLDFEAVSAHTITITSSDNGDPPASALFNLTVSVLDINEAPHSIILNNTAIGEHAQQGAVVGTFMVSDPDLSQDHIFSLVTSGEGRFRIMENQLIVDSALDYEERTQYDLLVRVWDNGVPPISHQDYVTVKILDENDLPTGIILIADDVEEYVNGDDMYKNKVIGTLITTDPDATDLHAYLRVYDDTHHCFFLDIPNILVDRPECFDYEVRTHIGIMLLASDSKHKVIWQFVSFNIVDVNEPIEDVMMSSSVVVEYSPLGTIIGVLSIQDPDRTDVHTIKILHGPTYVAISDQSLVVSGDVEYTNRNPSFEITVEVIDLAHHSFNKTFTVEILPVNNPPNDVVIGQAYHNCTNIQDNWLCISEDMSPFSPVADLQVSDLDGDILNCELIAGSAQRLFTVDANFTIWLGSESLNYEDIPFGHVFVLFIKVEDEFGLSTLSEIHVQVLDANDPPERVTFSTLTFSSSAAIGESIAIATCVDEDVDDVHSFSLPESEERFTINGNRLQVQQAFDTSSNINHPLTITCSDGQETVTSSFILTSLMSVGDATVDVHLDSTSVLENQNPLTIVGVVSASGGKECTFTVIADSSNKFGLRNNNDDRTAHLFTIEMLDHEEASSYYVTIQATCKGAVGLNTFEILVVDINEPPYEIKLHHQAVYENQIDTIVGIVTVIDPEGDELMIRIENDQLSPFKVETDDAINTFKVLTDQPLNFELGASVIVDIQAYELQDPSIVSETFSFNITVIDINEAPTAVGLSSKSINENSPENFTIGHLIIADPDSVHTHQRFICHLINNAGARLVLDADLNLQVAHGASIDYESLPNNKSLYIDVVCYDQQQLTVYQSIYIDVIDINEAPTDIIAQSDYSIKENQPEGSVVTRLQSLDQDQDDVVRLSVIDNNFFHVSGNQLVASMMLNYEAAHQHVVTLLAEDRSGLTFTKDVIIDVLNQNDPPTEVKLPLGSSVPEHCPQGTLVGQLATTDQDVHQNHTYRIQYQNPAGVLVLVNNSYLVVAEGMAVDYESMPVVEIIVVVFDYELETSLSHVQNLRIPVLDINEPPLAISLDSLEVNENSPRGTWISQVIISDPDTFPQAFFCTLLNDANGAFEIGPQEDNIVLEVGNSNMFNYEKSDHLVLSLRCRDPDLNVVQETFVINVIDVNDPPQEILFTDVEDGTIITSVSEVDFSWIQVDSSILTQSTVIIEESSIPSLGVVAVVAVLDEDEGGGDDVLLELISENAFIEYQSTGRTMRDIETRSKRSMEDDIPSEFMVYTPANSIIVKEALDFERRSEYMLYLKASSIEDSNMFVLSSLRVLIADVDEAPTNISLSKLTVDENSHPDTLVGIFNVTDPDSGPADYAYMLLSQAAPFYIQGNKLYVLHNIDYELSHVITIQVKVEQVGSGLILIRNIDIKIVNINEPPTGLTLDGEKIVNVQETLTIGSVVGMLQADDPELDILSFTITDHVSDNNVFVIHGDMLITASELNAWEQDSYALHIVAKDPSGLTLHDIILIKVDEVNQCDAEYSFCSRHATCLHNRCKCTAGFTGNGSVCIDIDECLEDPCHPHNSNGMCQNGIGGVRNFTCDCKEGWAEPDCTVPVDACAECNVQGTSLCINQKDGFACRCKEGFIGQLCDVVIDECTIEKCLNNGTCVSGSTGYKCLCKEPFGGVNCDTDYSICSNVTCSHDGVCIPNTFFGSYACRCIEPSAADCNGCSYGYGGDDCRPCIPPWTGRNCEIDGSVCTPNPCQYGGVCVPYDDTTHACICPYNFSMRDILSSRSTGSSCSDNPPLELMWRGMDEDVK